MPQLSIASVVFLIGVGVYTVVAAVWDIRFKKVPNKLTLPFLGLGIVYQLAFHSWAGLGDAGLGFLVGFGLLFLMWMVGGGGGGDVKLMGALSVWLGFNVTVMVMLGTVVLAIFGTMGVIVFSMFGRGLYGTKDKYLATGKLTKDKKVRKETIDQRTNRRAMGYAVPVALATWVVVVWRLPTFPWIGESLFAGLM